MNGFRHICASMIYNIYKNVLGRVRQLRTRIRSLTAFRCSGSQTCKNTYKCCTGATWRSKWPAPACSGAASALEGAVRACFGPAGALKRAALLWPAPEPPVRSERLIELAWAPPVRSKWPVWRSPDLVSVLKEAVRACFGAASALKEAFRACCSRSLFAKAGLGCTVL